MVGTLKSWCESKNTDRWWGSKNLVDESPWLVSAFGPNFWPVVGTYECHLPFCESRWGGGSTWKWWGKVSLSHPYKTCNNPETLLPVTSIVIVQLICLRCWNHVSLRYAAKAPHQPYPALYVSGVQRATW